MKANRNSFQAKTMTKTATASMPCAASGRITRTSVVTRPAPSTAAASSSSRGIWSMKARMTKVPRLTKNVAYRMASHRCVSCSPRTFTAGNSGSVTTMGGISRTTISQNAESASHLPRNRA